MNMPDFARRRADMVETQIARRGVTNPMVLDAMRKVPREKFVGPGYEKSAYEDRPLSIGEGQTISQPFAVAHMIEAAAIGPDDRVLEVGAGSGYAATVMAEIAARVFTIERYENLGEAARLRLAALGYGNIELCIGDGSKGWPEKAPFNAIIVAAGGPATPAALKEQLVIGGRLIIPVGKAQRAQRLLRITRTATDQYEEQDLGGVAFVPLIGEQGWPQAPL